MPARNPLTTEQREEVLQTLFSEAMQAGLADELLEVAEAHLVPAGAGRLTPGAGFTDAIHKLAQAWRLDRPLIDDRLRKHALAAPVTAVRQTRPHHVSRRLEAIWRNPDVDQDSWLVALGEIRLEAQFKEGPVDVALAGSGIPLEAGDGPVVESPHEIVIRPSAEVTQTQFLRDAQTFLRGWWRRNVEPARAKQRQRKRTRELADVERCVRSYIAWARRGPKSPEAKESRAGWVPGAQTRFADLWPWADVPDAEQIMNDVELVRYWLRRFEP